MKNFGEVILKNDIKLQADLDKKWTSFECNIESDGKEINQSFMAIGSQAEKLEGLKAGQVIKIQGNYGEDFLDKETVYVAECSIVQKEIDLPILNILPDEKEAKKLFIASNSFDRPVLIDLLNESNVNTITPESMLHEFSNRYSLLENSIKNKDDFMIDYLISKGASLESFKITNPINGSERNHNPIGLAIATGNENALDNMLKVRTDLLNETHVDLLYKVAGNRELTPTAIRDIKEVIEPICLTNNISFNPELLNMMYDIKAVEDNNFKTFYSQLLNANSPVLVENSKINTLSEFVATLHDGNDNMVYTGKFVYGKPDGLHYNVNENNVITVTNFDKGREINIPKDVEVFIALENNSKSQITQLTTTATINSIQPDNNKFIKQPEFGPLSLVETAISEGKNDAAKFFIDKGCWMEQYDIKTNTPGETRKHDPIMMAIKTDNMEMLNYIVAKRPDLITPVHQNAVENLQKKENHNSIKNIATDITIKELPKIDIKPNNKNDFEIS